MQKQLKKIILNEKKVVLYNWITKNRKKKKKKDYHYKKDYFLKKDYDWIIKIYFIKKYQKWQKWRYKKTLKIWNILEVKRWKV